MGNDGVHDIDYTRWGLGVETHPTKISAIGGKYFFDDDQEFPDTQQVTFEYPGDGKPGSQRMLIYEQRLWSHELSAQRRQRGRVLRHQGADVPQPPRQDRGARRRATSRSKSTIDARSRRTTRPTCRTSATPFAAARSSTPTRSTGHLSTSLCHLGNIATRVGPLARRSIRRPSRSSATTRPTPSSAASTASTGARRKMPEFPGEVLTERLRLTRMAPRNCLNSWSSTRMSGRWRRSAACGPSRASASGSIGSSTIGRPTALAGGPCATAPNGAFIGRGGIQRAEVEGSNEVELGFGLLPDFWARAWPRKCRGRRCGWGSTRLGSIRSSPSRCRRTCRSRRVMEKVGLHFERNLIWADLPHVLYRVRG